MLLEGNKGKISYISTPNVGLQRKLREHFNVYHLDEYKTSIINSKTKEKSNNLYLKIKEKKEKKKMHSILTYQMSNRRLGCIDRDSNAVNNFKIIVESLLESGERPLEYRRTKTKIYKPL